MDDLNAACRARTLTMAPDESEKFLYNGVDIDSTGRLRILFKPERLGVNLDECLADDKLADALNAAPVPEGSETGLPYNAKNSVEKGWTSKAEELRSSIADVLNNPDIKLTPNFEATFQKLTAAKAAGASLAVNEFDVSLGNFTAEYFSGLASYLKYKDFDKDDMLQEAFNEAVSKNEIAFRVVDSTKGTYGECVIEDGVLFLQVRS